MHYCAEIVPCRPFFCLRGRRWISLHSVPFALSFSWSQSPHSSTPRLHRQTLAFSVPIKLQKEGDILGNFFPTLTIVPQINKKKAEIFFDNFDVNASKKISNSVMGSLESSPNPGLVFNSIVDCSKLLKGHVSTSKIC